MAEPGCDSPEVNLKLDRNLLPAGEMLSGSFLFWREFMERTDTTIDVEFLMRAQLDDQVIEQVIGRFQTQGPNISGDSPIVEYSFAYQVPLWIPVSTHAIRYYVRPKFPFDEETEDFVDTETIIIQPNQVQKRIMSALNELGFQENLDSRYWNGKVQEFDFTSSKDAKIGVQELTVLFHPEKEQVQVHLYADQREPVSFLLTDELDVAVALRKALMI
jgi:sporulation-control protein